jgi:hypothetical protein
MRIFPEKERLFLNRAQRSHLTNRSNHRPNRSKQRPNRRKSRNLSDQGLALILFLKGRIAG